MMKIYLALLPGSLNCGEEANTVLREGEAERARGERRRKRKMRIIARVKWRARREATEEGRVKRKER